MPESSFDHPLFGALRFRTVSPEWKRGYKIVFLSGFDLANVTKLTIPQLKSIPGATGGTLRVHKLAHAQLLKAFEIIEEKIYSNTLKPALELSASDCVSLLAVPSASYPRIMHLVLQLT